jgi:hypothetical protein
MTPLLRLTGPIGLLAFPAWALFPQFNDYIHNNAPLKYHLTTCLLCRQGVCR